jgi:hypothetical protein
MRALAAIAVAALLLSGCVDEGRPDASACAAPDMELDARLTTDGLEGDDLAVCRDQEVTIHVDPEVDGVLHVHGYDEQLPATSVTAGEPIDLVFTAARSGQFAIEFHPIDDPRGIEVGILAVYEP